MKTSQDQLSSTPRISQLTTEPLASHGMSKMRDASRVEPMLPRNGAKTTGAMLPQKTPAKLVSTIPFSLLTVKSGLESSSSPPRLASQLKLRSVPMMHPQPSLPPSLLFQLLPLPPLSE